MSRKIRLGDEVIVTTGDDRGRRGKVIRWLAGGRIVVRGVNLGWRCAKRTPSLGRSGEVSPVERPIHASNVALLNPNTGRADRVRFARREERWIRVFRSDGQPVD